MHEAALAEGILHMAETHARGAPVVSLRVRIGAIAGVSKDSLDFWLRTYLDEKGLSRVSVDYAVLPVKIRCRCGTNYTVDDLLQPCPACGMYNRTILQGQECALESIEVSDEPNHSD